MTARILDGKATLATIKDELRERVARLKEQGVVPGLGTVLVGDDPGSHWYVGAKHKDCASIGIESIRRDLPATATQAEVEAVIDELNADPSCTGFLVQQPTGLDEFALLSRVDPDKDVDGLHPVNLGKLVLGRPGPLPCTPVGVIELLRRHGVEIAGAEVCVVGRGLTVGRPLGLLLTRRSENATVTLCHTGTRDLAKHVREADIVVAAAGVPGIITADMVKPGAALLDVGVSRVDGKIAGDLAPDVYDVAGWVSPNPGGVGGAEAAAAAADRRRHGVRGHRRDRDGRARAGRLGSLAHRDRLDGCRHARRRAHPGRAQRTRRRHAPGPPPLVRHPPADRRRRRPDHPGCARSGSAGVTPRGQKFSPLVGVSLNN